ncbi:uncharacterized protein [Chelonus insularis]|uniref:uncharacterized protein n=1 Tax=Chelonus insularis TaxID=460826 RepID=UPI00158DF7F3|nr:uncharacterized protein LOC118074880 [Chelonus insularis]
MPNRSGLNLPTKMIANSKWILMMIVLIIIITIIIIHQSRKKMAILPSDEHYVMKDVYDYVYQRWYNFSKGDKWYNKYNLSMFDLLLINEIRDNWIIGPVNINNTSIPISNDSYVYEYLKLMNPEIEDPSMGQSQAIKEYFNNKMNGFFIECGAYDGETRSNTLNLERFYNWTGILIEADPENFSLMLQKNRRAYLSPTCLSIKSRPMNTSFLMAKNIGRIHIPHGSESNELENSPDIAHKGTHVDVQCFPLASYIKAVNVKTVDYLSLDVEGNEMEILETIPFDKVDIKALSVEYTHVSKGRQYMIDFMDRYGYYVYTFVNKPDNLANDIIFVKRSYI